MHEIALVKNMFQMLEESFPGRIENIRTITLTAGLLSNVQPILIQNAFDAVLKEEQRYKNVSLQVKILPILIHCTDCDATTEIKHYTFVCSCGLPCNNIIQGQELSVTEIEWNNIDLN